MKLSKQRYGKVPSPLAGRVREGLVKQGQILKSPPLTPPASGRGTPLIIGLTGGIGMGKSTAAKILNAMGFPVYSADHAVHTLLRQGGKAVKPVAKLFPESLKKGAIDRAIVGRLVFGQPAKLKQLEKILHPLVHEVEKDFLKQAKKDKAKAVILEIPLLFETGADKRCDYVICVSAPKAVQKERVMLRKGMTAARLKAILSRQMPDAEKRRRADFVVQTGVSRVDTRKQLLSIMEGLRVQGSGISKS
jgi:dephospho-CoA kinase